MITSKWRFVGGLSRHEVYHIQSISLHWVFIKKSYLPAIDKYVIQCGFRHHIARIVKACKQINQSVYVLFWLFRAYIQFFLINNATNPSFTSGLRVKGDKRVWLTSFQKKGGEKHETIFFSDHNRKSV